MGNYRLWENFYDPVSQNDEQGEKANATSGYSWYESNSHVFIFICPKMIIKLKHHLSKFEQK